MPPCWTTHCETLLEELASRGGGRPRDRRPATSRVESTMSTNRTVASFRSTLQCRNERGRRPRPDRRQRSSITPCSTRRSSRRTTSGASIRRARRGRRLRDRRVPTPSSSSRGGSPSGTTCGCRRPRWPRRRSRALRTQAPTSRLGLVGTEMLYHAVAELALDGGICVTASHNPKEYTGMKIVRRGALPVGGDSGLSSPRARAEAGFGAARARGAVQRGGRMAELCRQGAVVRRRRRDPSAPRRHRRRERHGRRDAPAGARAASQLEVVALLLRAGRELPEPRAEPAAAREPRVHRREDESRKAPTSGSPSTGTPTAASSSTTRARSSQATSSRRCSPRRCSRKSRARR